MANPKKFHDGTGFLLFIDNLSRNSLVGRKGCSKDWRIKNFVQCIPIKTYFIYKLIWTHCYYFAMTHQRINLQNSAVLASILLTDGRLGSKRTGLKGRAPPPLCPALLQDPCCCHWFMTRLLHSAVQDSLLESIPLCLFIHHNTPGSNRLLCWIGSWNEAIILALVYVMYDEVSEKKWHCKSQWKSKLHIECTYLYLQPYTCMLKWTYLFIRWVFVAYNLVKRCC